MISPVISPDGPHPSRTVNGAGFNEDVQHTQVRPQLQPAEQ